MGADEFSLGKIKYFYLQQFKWRFQNIEFETNKLRITSALLLVERIM